MGEIKQVKGVDSMFTVVREMPVNAKHEALVVGLFDKQPPFNGMVAEWNEKLNGQLLELFKEGDLSAKKKHVSKVHTLGQTNVKRLYFVGLGKESELTFDALREVFGKLFKTLKGVKWTEVAVALDTFTTERIDVNDAAHALAEAFALATYQFAGYKQKSNEPEKKDRAYHCLYRGRQRRSRSKSIGRFSLRKSDKLGSHARQYAKQLIKGDRFSRLRGGISEKI